MSTSLPKARYETAPRVTAFFDDALRRIRAIPGVQAAAAVDDLPVQGGSVQPIVLEGHAELLPRDQPTVNVRKITTDYLRVIENRRDAQRDSSDDAEGPQLDLNLAA